MHFILQEENLEFPFIRKDSKVEIALPGGEPLKDCVDYKAKKEYNASDITKARREKIDKARTAIFLVDYEANEASKIGFGAWGDNQLNPPDGWRQD